MYKFKVKYTLEIAGHETELSTIVEYDKVLDTKEDMNNIIEKANTFINGNMHIPIDVLNEADIEVIPSP